MDRQLTEDNFDDVAREAGGALRRPAPADGIAQIRSARRRQQQVRAATGVTAAVLIVAVGAAVLFRRGDDEPAVMIQPDSTVPAASTAPPTTEAAPPATTAPERVSSPSTAPATPPTTATTPTTPTTPTSSTSGLGADAGAWVDARVAEGLGRVNVVDGIGTTARLLVAENADISSVRSAVLLDDGRVVESPRRMSRAPVELFGLGGLPAVIDYGADFLGDPLVVWRYDPATDVWSATEDLGIGPIRDAFFGSFDITVVDDVLVVTNDVLVSVDESNVAPSPDQRGVVVRPDLSVAAMAPTPAGISTFFNTASGGKAIQVYGESVEGGYGVDVSYDQPWQFDPMANEWSEIPIPDWMSCTSGEPDCVWSEFPDIGADTVAEPTDRGLVVRIPDGSLGLYDAATSTWTRLDDAPFTLAMPAIATVGDQMVVAPWRSSFDEFGTVGVLDLATGTWTTEQIDIPTDVEARFDTEWFDVGWDLRVSDGRVLAVPGPSFGQSPLDPIAVYDTGSRAWSAPTADDIAAWRALTTQLAG